MLLVTRTSGVWPRVGWWRKGLALKGPMDFEKMDACILSHFSCVRLFATPWTIALQAPLSMGFCRQEYWSGWPWNLPAVDLPNPGIESESPTAGRFFTIWATRERQMVMSKSERVVTKEKIRLTVAVSAEFFFSFNGPSRWINTYLHFLTLSSWDRGYHPHHFVERRREVGQSVQNHTVTKRNRVSVWTQVIRLQNFCSLLQGAA